MPRLFIILLGLPALLSAADLSERAYQILRENCFACHGAAMQMSGLDLRTRAKAVQGGERGPAVSPTSLDLSFAWKFVTNAAKPSMPPGGKLSDDDIETLRKWIVAGAPFPETPVSNEDAERLAALKKLEDRPITDEERQWWAFQPPVRRQPPPLPGNNADNLVDVFLLAKLNDEGLRPAPPADKRTLIRRAYLDLTGLPPNPAEVEAFIADTAPDAWQRLVDRLLDSSHYGERWGRHWLDLVHYADSGGYERDFDWPTMWRYRDYVIEAFNSDKPYNRFILEQIAGDEINSGNPGDPGSKGSRMDSGVLTVAAWRPVTYQAPPAGATTSHHRRQFAEWIASEKNPLTARVMVNRIWRHHFGEGIVRSVSNFGTMGEKPSHPVLLDWLATEFVRSGWSVKHMHRVMMNSAAYRRSSNDVAANLRADPGNRLFWRMPRQRLEAEILRDQILAAAGTLDRTTGGPAVRPYIDPDLWQSSTSRVWGGKAVGARETWRRSVYVFSKRSIRYPMFEAFDQPDMVGHCSERASSTVAPQALLLMNNAEILLQAKFFAQRVIHEAGHKPTAQVERAFQLALGRTPRGSELWRSSNRTRPG